MCAEQLFSGEQIVAFHVFGIMSAISISIMSKVVCNLRRLQ